MSYSYFDNDKQIRKLDIQAGTNWSDYKTDNDTLNSIFNDIDNGDGIVQLSEKMLVDSLLKQADNQIEASANNNILENEELEKFDFVTNLLQSKFDENLFTLENVKSAYPEDKYNYTKERDATVITEKDSGKKIMYYKSLDNGKWKYIEEYTGDNKVYTVRVNRGNNEISLGTESRRNNDFHFAYRNGDIQDLVGTEYNFRLLGKQKINEELLFRQLENPEWLKDNAIDYIDKIPAKDLLNTISDYNKRTGDFLLDKIYSTETIPEDIRYEFANRTLQRLEDATGYKQKMTNENSQVKTDFYQSKNTYTVRSENDIITITKNIPEGSTEEVQEYKIDLNRLVSQLPLDMQPKTKSIIQNLPGEVLVDMSIECDVFNSPKNDTAEDNVAGRFYPVQDRITFGFNSFSNINQETIVHELGHAIDHRQIYPGVIRGLANYSILQNNDLKDEYYKAKYTFAGVTPYLKENPETHEIEKDEAALLAEGFLTVDNEGKTVWSEKFNSKLKKAYMFSSVYEGPSELYVFAMLGESNITPKEAVTPELMAEFLKSLEYTRSLTQEDRHTREKE